jgi:hypothetical protein
VLLLGSCAPLLLDCLASLMEKVVEAQSADAMHKSALSLALSFASKTDPSIQISVFSVLASIAAAHPCTIRYSVVQSVFSPFVLIFSMYIMDRDNWTDRILPFLQAGLQSSVHAMNLSALKVLEHFAHSANSINLELGVDWWKSVFEMTAHLWMLPVCNIRCISCNLIGQVPEAIFYNLEVRMRSSTIHFSDLFMLSETLGVSSCNYYISIYAR